MRVTIYAVSDESYLPVVVGLSTGVMFVVLMAIVISITSTSIANVTLRAEWDKEGQQKAVDILLADPELRAFVAGKNLRVIHYAAMWPNPSFEQGICKMNECTLIGLEELNPDGTIGCGFKTFVNIETGKVDRIFYNGACDASQQAT